MFSIKLDKYTDSDSDIEDYINDAPLPEIDSDFRTKMLKCKNTLYDAILFSTAEEAEIEDARYTVLLKKYLKCLDRIYNICKHLQNRNTNQIPELNEFPENSRESIKELCEYVRQYFINNSLPDTIPYTDYIKKNLHEYPFVRINSFEDD